jgi:crossover junction endodeoxyribonuclease RuvC
MANIRIIGIDPGLRNMGWGVIEAQGSRLRFVAAGTVHPPKDGPMGERLLSLAGGLEDVLHQHAPDCAALEETFVNAGPRSALALGQARGVCLMVLASSRLPVGEYAATVVKKAVVGTGRAEKLQVQDMVSRLLPGARAGSADEADALAIAICHASHAASLARMSA